MKLAPGTRMRMVAHTLACLPEEACGLVWTTREGLHLWPCENLAHSTHRFEIGADAVRELSAQAIVTACFHSHPNGPDGLSVTDVDLALPGLTYLVYSVPDRSLTAWIAHDGRAVELALED